MRGLPGQQWDDTINKDASVMTRFLRANIMVDRQRLDCGVEAYGSRVATSRDRGRATCAGEPLDA